jgi:hypothetical protein
VQYGARIPGAVITSYVGRAAEVLGNFVTPSVWLLSLAARLMSVYVTNGVHDALGLISAGPHWQRMDYLDLPFCRQS